MECKMIGVSPKIRRVKKIIEIISKAYKTPVLIQGEIGTGKNFASKAIHYQSERKDKPLIKMNCAATTDLFLESELFGCEKGAFNGAKYTKKGLLELANGGTIYLCEIEEMDTFLHSKICRFLDDQTFVRAGGEKRIRVDTRMIASTTKDLERLVREGLFLKDLYDRLKMWVVEMPPLRNRGEDIILFLDRFIIEDNLEYAKNIKGMSEEAMQLLIRYHWPGNIIELKNVIERAIILADEEYITPEQLPFELRQSEKVGQENTVIKSFEITNKLPLVQYL